MSAEWPSEAIVYTETVVHTPPERYAADAPYQLAIVQSPNGGRFTVRILNSGGAGRAHIGDKVRFLEEREGVPFYSAVCD